MVGAPKPTTEKVGNILKCPACGEVIESFQTRCASCGHELRNIQTTSSIHTFFEKLESAGNWEKKVELIESFPIPNTKEDIYEFIIMASSNVKTDYHVEFKAPTVSHSLDMSSLRNLITSSMNTSSNNSAPSEETIIKALNNAWMTKINQAYTKAQITMTSAPQDLERLTTIVKELNIRIQKSKNPAKVIMRNPMLRMGLIVVLLFVFLGVFSSIYNNSENKGPIKETQRLERLSIEIEDDIANNDLTIAEEKTLELTWKFRPSYSEYKKNVAEWNKKREEIQTEIKTLKKKKN
jgi:ABC-type multidrug transport system fused ATPase/permease subunit